MNFPAELKYVESHEWVRIDGNTVTIGITDFAQSELGDVVFVDISAEEGDELNAGASFGTIEAVKTVSDIYMPISGKITAINGNLGDAPETLNKDPYGEGWLIKIESSDLDNDALMAAAAYQEMVSG